MPCSIFVCCIENNGIEYPCLAVFYVVLNTVGLNICALQYFLCCIEHYGIEYLCLAVFLYVVLKTMGLNIRALQFFMLH